MSRWDSHNKYSKMAITNNFVALNHGHTVATELSRAQLCHTVNRAEVREENVSKDTLHENSFPTIRLSFSLGVIIKKGDFNIMVKLKSTVYRVVAWKIWKIRSTSVTKMFF